MTNNKNNKEKLSFEEECLMWSSYRYCIGRKTYVQSMAHYIAKKYYPLLSEARMLFAASDIRQEIEQHFNWMGFNFHYDGTVNRCDRKPYEDCIQFLMSEIVKDGMTTEEITKEVCRLKDVEVYHEHYGDGEPHKYRICYKQDADVRDYYSLTDINDYKNWAALASLFDKKNYKKIHIKSEVGGEQDIICFETWVEDSMPCKDNPNCYQYWPWHWKRVYVAIDNYINDSNFGYLYEPYIVSIEDYDAREDKTDDKGYY